VKNKVSIILTGLNGYGENFVKELLKENNALYELVAVVSGNPEKSKYYNALLEHGVKMYQTIDDCLNENKVDLAIITTPMHIHYREVVCALKHGANVFCEKPLAPTIDECLEIKRLSDQTNLFVAVGFQWSFSKAIQNLKKDILANKFGKVKKMKTIVRWYRPKSYFENSNWKGKNVDKDGKYILDNLMSNSASHHLHNLLFLSGNELFNSANPTSIEGEGYKAYKIDGYDTVFMRINTDNDCELLYLATIVSEEEKEACFEMELEEATVYYSPEKASNIIVKTKDGRILEYGSPEEGRFEHWLLAVDAIRSGKKLACDINTILPEVVTVNAAIENIPAIPFSPGMIEEDEKGIVVRDINGILECCFHNEKLPSEIGYAWASKANKTDLKGYKTFSGIASL
jgi:predicted dehydrogenase